MDKHDTDVKGVAVHRKLKVQVVFHIIDYLDGIASLSVYTTNTGRIQFKVLTTLPMTTSSFLLEFKGFWDKIVN